MDTFRSLATSKYLVVFLSQRNLKQLDVYNYIDILFPAITHTVEEGHNIELECSATGPSPPVIHWLFNGVHINQV